MLHAAGLVYTINFLLAFQWGAVVTYDDQDVQVRWTGSPLLDGRTGEPGCELACSVWGCPAGTRMTDSSASSASPPLLPT
eukprot:364298-Chlamydomonas_euryale.AAC.3